MFFLDYSKHGNQKLIIPALPFMNTFSLISTDAIQLHASTLFFSPVTLFNRSFAASDYMLGYRIPTPCLRASSLINEGLQRIQVLRLKENNSVVCDFAFWTRVGRCWCEIDSTAERKRATSYLKTSQVQEVLSSSSAQSPSCFFHSRVHLKRLIPQEKVL